MQKITMYLARQTGLPPGTPVFIGEQKTEIDRIDRIKRLKNPVNPVNPAQKSVTRNIKYAEFRLQFVRICG